MGSHRLPGCVRDAWISGLTVGVGGREAQREWGGMARFQNQKSNGKHTCRNKPKNPTCTHALDSSLPLLCPLRCDPRQSKQLAVLGPLHAFQLPVSSQVASRTHTATPRQTALTSATAVGVWGGWQTPPLRADGETLKVRVSWHPCVPDTPHSTRCNIQHNSQQAPRGGVAVTAQRGQAAVVNTASRLSPGLCYLANDVRFA